MVLKIFRVNSNNPLPMYMTDYASGIDLYASIDKPVSIYPGEYKSIPTGVIIALPAGYEAQVRPRSGLALKFGITLLNSPGTVDADYRGEIKVLLINHGKEPFTVINGMRIAQLVIARIERADIVEVARIEELENTRRSSGGFGHTGV